MIAKQLSVRQTEALVRREREGGGDRPTKPELQPSAGVRDLQSRLERALGTKVRLVQKDVQSGKIEVDYHSLDHLDTLLEKLLRR